MFTPSIALALFACVGLVSGHVYPATCQDICDATGTCLNDPQEHGSYCKGDNTCFGLYTQVSGNICFQPNDPACDDTQRAVTCPDNCQAFCDATDACLNDPQEHGSYCKSDNTCFGLYTRLSGVKCFQPNDPTCDDTHLAPVSCTFAN